MPARRPQTASDDTRRCLRCQINVQVITVRTEPLCKACFCRYVSTKVVKRMESFRVRHATPGEERTLLLPLSFGHCSLTLLHVLSEHLKRQALKTGRTGFRLRVLHVCTSPADFAQAGDLFAKLKQRNAEHEFSLCQLSDICSILGTKDLFVTAGSHDYLSNPERLGGLTAYLKSASSRADVIQILLRKLVAVFAKQNSCDAILWGDSTTSLAERTLAETAKGRGASLPWVGAEGNSLGGVPCYYPLRDLMRKEVAAFASFVEPSLDDIVVQNDVKPALSTKHATIDELMTQYFETVEQEYPSIVANVVRTTAKLQAPLLANVERHCELCDMPIYGQSLDRSRLCYGCVRTMQQANE